MLERSRRTLREGTARQRLEGSTRQLLQRSRETVAQIIGPTSPRESGTQDVLAGVCSSVALRDLNLVDSLLEQLERMEAEEDDPEALDRLYRLDHLATRLRRNGENLRVLAGRDAGGTRPESAALVDVVRAGMSSIEQYGRVEFGKVTDLGVVGPAADDVSRLLAELLDNATVHSPPDSAVTVSAHLTEQGSVMVRVEDSGIGLPAARLSALNERLASAPVLDREAVRHMGLAVVRRLSARHGIRVWLSRRAPHGTTASVLLPSTLVHERHRPDSRGGGKDPSKGTSGVPGTRPTPTAPVGRARTENPSGTEERSGPTAPRERTSAPPTTEEPAWPSEDQQTPRQRETESSTTANGLPRRVSQSLKGSSAARQDAPTPADRGTGVDMRRSHEQLLADLGAFAEGEWEAKQAGQDDNDDAERSQQ
ncbi:sensor histidine kinase [Actinopolyspora mortivallis]|uniref:histidine kinase n=1 Tax=Actinopolyspora mortivallis TaxID=33906 RepID=A0A2T0H1N9_ACTMO|nr:ATP-binding protein [Actinopolyspora mortivallis]